MFEPLLVVADLLGRRETVEKSIQEYIKGAEAVSDESDELRILQDMYDLFESYKDPQNRLSSAKAVEELNKMIDRPWREYNNSRGFTPHSLAQILRHWDISPSRNSERYMGREPVKVYYREAFEPNWKAC